MLKPSGREPNRNADFGSTRPDETDSLSAWWQLMSVGGAVAKAPRPRGEQRIYPRTIFSVPLKLYHLTSGGIASSSGMSLDLSEGGVGALVPLSLLVGEAVEIELQLPAGSLCAVAIVRYCSRVRAGFEFVGLSLQERQQISAALGRK